jgi:glucokinase
MYEKVITMLKDFILAIDLGGTATKIAILNSNGDFVHKWSIPTDTSDNGKHIIGNIKNSFEQKLKELNLNKEQFMGVGMGAPGPVLKDGVISKAVNLGWENFPLKRFIEDQFGFPAFVGNDANCAALGEMWKGAGQNLTELICITLGTGVGGGIITNGDIVDGSNGGAGEIGHMTVKLENGYRCNCSKEGCLETISSATGIARLATDKLKSSSVPSGLKTILDEKGFITAKDVFDLSEENDEIAVQVVEEVAYYLGYALGTLSAAFNPNAIVIGGGVSRAGHKLLEPVKKYFNQFAFPATREDTEILLATLGNDAGIIGAGWLVKKHFAA